MDEKEIQLLVADWDEVYKKGQLSLWILLAIYDGKKYAAQISDFMYEASKGAVEVKEQSLYRALRRFTIMGLVKISEEESPNSGPKRKYFTLTDSGEEVLIRFTKLHITPLLETPTITLLERLTMKGTQ